MIKVLYFVLFSRSASFRIFRFRHRVFDIFFIVRVMVRVMVKVMVRFRVMVIISSYVYVFTRRVILYFF